MIDLDARGLLRRHVGDGAENGPGVRPVRVARAGPVLLPGLGQLYQPEIEHLDVAVGSQDYVLGLYIAMDQTGSVSRVQGIGHLRAYIYRIFDTHRAALY